MRILALKTLRRMRGGFVKAAGSGDGLTLVETLIAILILSFGLLATGQMMYVAMGSASLSRSKSSAAVVAQNRIDSLADLYRQNPSAADLTVGNHGPQQVQVTNPVDGTVLNRFNVSWTVSNVSDPRAGMVLQARQVAVTVTPVNTAGNTNNRISLNKVVSVTAIFSAIYR